MVAIGDSRESVSLEEWAGAVNFSVGKGTIQTAAKYTLSRAQIAKLHKQYRNRLIYGAQYRADIVTATQLGITTVKEVVKLIGVSREPASRILAELRDAGVVIVSQPSHSGYLEAEGHLR